MFHTGSRAQRRLPMARRAWLLLAAVLAGCGGGGGDGGTAEPRQTPGCAVDEQKTWLSGYMDDWYFWYRLSPRPAAGAYGSVESYFTALLFGGGAGFPADRWSGWQSTESYNRFFGDGATLGYGVAVAGQEAAASSSQRLYVRYVDPGSPAAAAGLQRGDEIVSLNGIPAATLVAQGNLSALSAGQAGDVLQLVWAGARAGGGSLRLVAATYPLAPVNATTRLQGVVRSIGYLHVKDMISQALPPMDTAFAQFKAAGVQDLVLDLRYNGGGLVSTGATLASYVSGTRGAGLDYARLVMNDKQAASNTTYTFSNPAPALSLPRVFVLAGPRTCSASEQVVNGLRGAGVQVILVGATTCGKPVGFRPVNNCARTYSVVNFESVNQRGEGRYFSGLAPTCRVAENFTVPQGSTADPLVAAAVTYANTGACPPASSAPGPQVLSGAERRTMRGDDEGPGMVAR